MIKKGLLVLILLFMSPAICFTEELHYEDWEAYTLDTRVNDRCPFREPEYPWRSTACSDTWQAHSADQTEHVRDATNPDMPGVSGRSSPDHDQYLHLRAQWDDPEVCSSGGFGRQGFERGFVMFYHPDLASDMRLQANNGTEYWIGWSQYIPLGEAQQIPETGAFQAMTNPGDERILIQYWGRESSSFRAAFFDRDEAHMSAFAPDVSTHWDVFEGQWVDWVLRMVLYSTEDPSAKTHMYFNGVQFSSGQGDGNDNMPSVGEGAYLVWQNYNWFHCADSADGNCEQAAEDFYGCDNTGVWEDWTRNYIIDEIRINEYETGQGDHYCEVAPNIWAAQPTISSPAEGEGEVATTFTAQFSDYSDHKDDPQDCFDASDMQIHVNESGDDWSTLVYDSGSVRSGDSHVVSGLEEDTSYQIRVRHSATNPSRSTAHWGAWSNAVTFTTASTDGDADADHDTAVDADHDAAVDADHDTAVDADHDTAVDADLDLIPADSDDGGATSNESDCSCRATSGGRLSVALLFARFSWWPW